MSMENWVENRFLSVEERLARVEEGRSSEFDDNDEVWDSLDDSSDSAMTVGRLRARLAQFDPRCPVMVQVDDEPWDKYDEAEIAVWARQTLNRERSTGTHSVLDRGALIRVSLP